MKKYVIIILILYSGIEILTGAPGDSTATFLRIIPDARSSGMGESGVASINNVYSIFWNPSSLANIHSPEAGVSHTIWVFDTSYDYIGIVYPVKKIGTLGISFSIFSFGLSDTYINANGNITEEGVEAGDWSFTISYGKSVLNNLKAGGNIKLINQKLAGISKTTFIVEPALKYRINKVTLGLVIQNAGLPVEYDSDYEKDPLPLTVRAGGHYPVEFIKPYLGMIKKINISGDIVYTLDLPFKFGGGAELILPGASDDMEIALRIGLKIPGEGKILSYFTTGFGVIYNSICIDFAYRYINEDAGSVFNFSVIWQKPSLNIKKKQLKIKDKKLNNLRKKLLQIKKQRRKKEVTTHSINESTQETNIKEGDILQTNSFSTDRSKVTNINKGTSTDK